MIVTAKYAFVVQGHQILFKVANYEHPAAQVEQRFARNFGQHMVCDLWQIAVLCQRRRIDSGGFNWLEIVPLRKL
jgi:hypothetical protein